MFDDTQTFILSGACITSREQGQSLSARIAELGILHASGTPFSPGHADGDIAIRRMGDKWAGWYNANQYNELNHIPRLTLSAFLSRLDTLDIPSPIAR